MNNVYEMAHKAADAAMKPAKVALSDIEDFIVSEHYFTAKDGANEGRDNTTKDNKPKDLDVFKQLGLLTFCVLVLKNGFSVVGKSACVDARNFKVEEGKMIARSNALNEMWPLMGFALANKLMDEAA